METEQKRGKPNRVALTLAKARDAKPPAKGDYILWDEATRGLGLRIYSSGAKVWIAQKKLGKTPKRVVLGHFPDMPLAKAREEAPDAIQKIRKGIDPNLEKRQQLRETEKARDRENLTIGVAFEEYLAVKSGEPKGDKASGQSADKGKMPQVAANTLRDLEKAKKRLESGALWKLPIEAVDDLALQKEYRRLCHTSDAKKATNGGKTAAGGIFRYLRAAFNHAVQTHKLKLADNPFLGLNGLEKGWQTTPARTAIVAEAEGDLGRWWKAVEALRTKTDARARDSATIADWLQVALLLGGRKTQSLSLRWNDIDLERGIGIFWKTKNGKPHAFPLAPYVRAILERRKADNDKAAEPSDYVFPASRVGWKSKEKTHIKETKKSIGEVKKASGLSFAPHDLRRTFGTLINELEVGEITVKRTLNHAPRDVTDRHYIQTRLRALLPIYKRLETLVLIEVGLLKPEERPVQVEASQAEWEEFQRWKAASALSKKSN